MRRSRITITAGNRIEVEGAQFLHRTADTGFSADTRTAEIIAGAKARDLMNEGGAEYAFVRVRHPWPRKSVAMELTTGEKL